MAKTIDPKQKSPTQNNHQQNLQKSKTIVITILGSSHAECMYRKSIVITKCPAIVITINFSSPPHRLAGIPPKKNVNPANLTLRLLLTRIFTVALNDSQWPRNRQQTASTQSEQPQLPKHVFPIDRKMPKALTTKTRPVYPIFKNQE